MIVEPAPAKLNLSLHVRRRRADGYHDIETLFAFCEHGDVLTIEAAEHPSLSIAGPFAQDLGAGENLVSTAAALFSATFETRHNLRINLEKNLPIASGIGGGSADAAATLRALARLNGIQRDDPHLVEIARNLGADVPACLLGRAAFATGRGDDLFTVSALTGRPVLLINPRTAVSTAAVFARWDGVDRGPLDPADPASGRNDLEPAARQIAPVIAIVLAMLRERPGATFVRMSGSGATCFAMFGSDAERDAAASWFVAERPEWWRLATWLA